jgi:hypothetical protein
MKVPFKSQMADSKINNIEAMIKNPYHNKELLTVEEALNCISELAIMLRIHDNVSKEIPNGVDRTS